MRDKGSSSALAVPGYRAIVEREVHVEVTAFDWNRPQHITPRYTAEEVAPVLRPLRRQVDALEAENALLREQVASLQPQLEKHAPRPRPLEENP